MTEPSLDGLLAAAEPTGPAELRGLIDRLAAGGAALGARRDGQAIGPTGLAAIAVRGVTHDSREVRPGSIFVAVPGIHVDGHEFVEAAAAAGAAAALVEPPIAGLALPQLIVADSRARTRDRRGLVVRRPEPGPGGRRDHGYGRQDDDVVPGGGGARGGRHPDRDDRHGRDPDRGHPGGEPRARDDARGAGAPARISPRWSAAGDQAAVIETTSHGLALRRVDDIRYDVAILTNLTHEHLELHGTWEAYRDAKLRLFELLARRDGNPLRQAGKSLGWPPTGIVNADDPSAGAFIGVTQEAGARVLTYGTDASADIRATRIEEDRRRLRVAYDAPSGAATLELQLVGRFNVHNALAVVALGEAAGLDPAAVRDGLASLAVVPGRMERVDLGQPFGVVVDFAHSPASLQTVLDLLAPLAASGGGGVIAVFGSAGERDTLKRPLMGRIAGERARIVVVTDEDPRGEDAATINDAIARGAEAVGKRRDHDLLVIADRRAAIDAAIERARPGDIVLLAGKGHERSIIGPDGPIPWDERAEAESALHRAGFG